MGGNGERDGNEVPKELLDILVCPKCHGELEYRKDGMALICHNCRLRFRVLEGGIPDMLLEDAEEF